MTQKEKLIDLIIEAKRTDPETGSFTEYLADYLLANGVMVPPVKVGDTVYWPSYSRNVQLPDILEETVIEVDMSGFLSSEDAEVIRNKYQWEWNDIGQYVFLTREEAEKALAERGDDNV